MNKPDDVSQEAWDAARAAHAGYGREYDDIDNVDHRIARAIMAARLQERQRIAEYLMQSAGSDTEMRSYARYWSDEILKAKS